VSPIVERFIAEQGLEGAGLVVVDREDGVVYEDYWGSFSADRISLVASSSKMVTAGVLMRLDEDGLLDLDAPVAEVVDWGSANPDITPAQLISNSAGLVGLLPFPGYAPYRCQWDAAADLQTCGATIFTTRDDDGEVAPPDTEFRYGGAQWQVAGAVAEAASGRSWAELIEEVYVEPCGLASLGYNNHWSQLGTVGFDYPDAFAGDPATLRPTANPNMEGGMYTTPGDYAELLLMHLRGGRCSGGQVLSPEAVDRLHRDRVGAVYGGLAGAGSGYGMGWWVDVVTGRLTDSGAYGSTPWLDVQDGYGAYLVLEADAIMGYELSRQLFDVVEAAVTGS
jgi:CubicO group peptidase (beta-lactamase class C family)